jgi:hypothetical protein
VEGLSIFVCVFVTFDLRVQESRFLFSLGSHSCGEEIVYEGDEESTDKEAQT